MNISKLKLVLRYLTGGASSVAEYILDLFNEMIQKLPAVEVAKYAQLAKDTATFIGNCCVLISDAEKRTAAEVTSQSFAYLATALLDSKLTAEELDGIIAQTKKAIAAWAAIGKGKAVAE